MLVLTRKHGEKIIIDDKVEISVLTIRGSQVRIGINAPEDVSIHREEVYEKIKSRERSRNDEVDPSLAN